MYANCQDILEKHDKADNLRGSNGYFPHISLLKTSMNVIPNVISYDDISVTECLCIRFPSWNLNTIFIPITTVLRSKDLKRAADGRQTPLEMSI